LGVEIGKGLEGRSIPEGRVGVEVGRWSWRRRGDWRVMNELGDEDGMGMRDRIDWGWWN
jgi:hypothetical protein